MKGGRTLLRIKNLCLLLILSASLLAQRLPELSFDKYQFINQQADTVINADKLKTFFLGLEKLKSTAEISKLNVVHIGDSHIQGDFLTREVRLNFQKNFGNGGRGLVFPYRLARSYEPKDIRSESKNQWIRARAFGSKRFPELGISGYTVQSTDSLISFDLCTFNHDSLDYSFSKVSFISHADSSQYQLIARDTIADENYTFLSKDSDVSVCNLNKSTNQLKFQSVKNNHTQNKLTVNGLVLENDQPGVVYHVIGVNGAHFSDYNKSPLLFQQLPLLHPDIILVSLGTNEGVNPRVTCAEVKQAVEEMVKKISQNNPEVPVVLLTPFDNYYRNKSYNKYLGIIRSAIVEVAQVHNLPLIDAYQITGGYSSCSQWRKFGLLRPDGIHYTQDGYTLQGKIIYQALINSYLKYAAH